MTTVASVVPDFAVVGVAPDGAGLTMLDMLGFVAFDAGVLSAAAASTLFGLPDPARYQFLRVPGSAGGEVLAVTTEIPGSPRRGPAAGPIGLNVFTRDADELAGRLDRMGVARTEVVRYSVRDKTMADLRFTSADGVDVVAIAYAGGSGQRPSVLDAAPGRLTSEVTAVAWLVNDLAASQQYWARDKGLEIVLSNDLREPRLGTLLGIDDFHGMRYANLAAAGEPTAQLELFQLLHAESLRGAPVRVLCGGVWAVGLSTANLAAAARCLGGGREVTSTPFGYLAAGESPDGVRWLLRQLDG